MPSKIDNSVHSAAKDTCWLIFLKNDTVIVIDENLERVFFIYIQSHPQLFRQHNAAQFINFSHDSC